jgi:hypothetical protein
MATGLSTSLGYSIPQVGGMYPRAEFYDSVSKRTPSLMYELGLSSISPVFYQGKFISPLDVANKDLYSRFGKKKHLVNRKKLIKREKCKKLNKDCKKKITKKMCEKFLQSGKKINPLTGKPIKKDGPTYKLLMKKCKVVEPVIKDLSGIKPLHLSSIKPLHLSGKLDKKIIPKKLDYLDLSVFTGKKPELPPSSFRPSESLRKIKYLGNPGVQIYPVWVQPPSSKNEISGTKYVIQPRKFISFNGKEFKIGSKANIDYTGTKSTITNIGLKQLTLKKDLMSKENRLTIENFLKFNKYI